MFPTISLLNIGSVPVFRLDFLAQIAFLIGLLSIKNIKMRYETVFFYIVFIIAVTLLPISVNIQKNYFDLNEAIEAALQTILFTSTILLCALRNVDEISFSKIIESLLLLSLLICLFSFYQFFSLNIYSLPFDRLYFNAPAFEGTIVESGFGGSLRTTSIFKEPSHLGFFSANIFIICLVINTQFVSLKKRWLHGTLSLSTLVLSNSMASIVVLPLLLAFYIWHKLGFLKALMVILLVILATRIMLVDSRAVSVLIELASFNPAALTDGSAITRIARVIIGLSVFAENPWFGIGGNQIGAYPARDIPGLEWFEYSQDISFTNFHIVGILAESGIIGFLSWSLIIISGLFFIKKNAIRKSFMLAFYLYVYNILSIDLPIFSPYRLLPLIIAFSFTRISTDDKK